MSLSSYFIPKYIASFSSPYNPSIRIYESNGKLSLYVGGSPQSGEYIKRLWKKTLHHFGIQKLKNIHTILVFGIAGGTVISLLSHLFPNADITAVDIDEVMIDIGKKYFHLDYNSRVTLLEGDAKKYVKECKEKKKQYDLVIVDVYSGRHIPTFVETKPFLLGVKSIVSPHGRVCINYLRELEYEKKSNLLQKELTGVFSQVSEYGIAANRFFLAS